ncbi:unnamed protein product [Paramecium pentaurelia]|uniref:Protein kinase domain-containing protein n=1 Tax=Paramecium pentaurelia TaxID=43138 RepID=A0A8S1S1J1_9CILI|nr:unnamed protein product [Paramecium pentaurelia]
MNQSMEKSLENKGYKIQSLLGKGAFGKVFKGLKNNNQQQVAIKTIEISRFSENDGIFGQLVQSEIQALKMIKSDHVVGFVDTFSDMKYCYIIMEYCDSGDLENQLKNPNFKITEQDALGIFKQILKGLRDLHSKYIIHRDLKVQNILVHNNSIYKIADLGFCKLLQAADQESRLQLGSLFTMAPEIFNQKPYGLSSDMFSLGVIFYQILYNRYPFKQKDYLQDYQPNINFQKNKIEVSEKTQNLLFQMLQFDPQKRISFKDLINHPAFDRPIFSLISKIQLQSNRISFDDYGEFYNEKSGEIEANLKNNIGHQQMPQIVQVQHYPKLEFKNFELEKIQEDNKNKLSLEIDKINEKINQMYFFSNTFQELIQFLQSPNIMVLLCLKLQKLCENIINMIIENRQIYQQQKQYELDYNILEEQYREMVNLSEGIIYQLHFLQEQLINYNQNIFAQKMSEQQFNKLFYEQLSNYLSKVKNNITNAISHLIFCYLYCITQNSQFLQFDETTFDLKRSKQLYKNSDHLLEQIQLFSNKISKQNY